MIDAFADRPMHGNPAVVCLLEAWLPAQTMQNIAAEFNLSETAFIAPTGASDTHNRSIYDIRWFTPTCEVDMIGHATLAAGHLVLSKIAPSASEAVFNSPTGTLTVRRNGRSLDIEMPALVPHRIDAPDNLAVALGMLPKEVWVAKHYLAIFETAKEVAGLRPDFAALARLPLPAVIVTAKEQDEFDFVSRFFAPANGVPEDPVSGVAHCCLAPYWSKRLGKSDLTGRQISRRGGTVGCKINGDRVILSGSASIFLEGRIVIEAS